MQKFHKTSEVINYLISVWYFLIIGFQILAGIFLIGVALIFELFKALRDMRKKGTIPQQQYRYAKKHITRDDSKARAMQRWRH